MLATMLKLIIESAELTLHWNWTWTKKRTKTEEKSWTLVVEVLSFNVELYLWLLNILPPLRTMVFFKILVSEAAACSVALVSKKPAVAFYT